MTHLCMLIAFLTASEIPRAEIEPAARAKILYADIVENGVPFFDPRLEHLVECGEPAVQYLVEMLRSDNEWRVRESLMGLSEIRPKGLTREVASLIAREDVRTYAIMTLGEMGDRKAIPELRRALRDTDNKKWRKTIVGSLAVLGDRGVNDELLMMTRGGVWSFCTIGTPIKFDTRTSGWIAVKAISQFEPERRWRWIKRLLQSDERNQQDIGGAIASRVGETRARDLLLRLGAARLKHSNKTYNVEMLLFDYLSNLGEERFVPYVLEFVGDSTLPSLSPCFSVLARCESEAAKKAVRHWWFAQTDRNAMSHVVSESRDHVIVEDWLSVFQNAKKDKGEDIDFYSVFDVQPLNLANLRIATDLFAENRGEEPLEVLARYISYFENKNSLGLILHLADSDLPEERKAIATGLGNCTTAGSLETLLRLSEDADESVGDAAMKSLRMHGVILRKPATVRPAS